MDYIAPVSFSYLIRNLPFCLVTRSRQRLTSRRVWVHEFPMNTNTLIEQKSNKFSIDFNTHRDLFFFQIGNGHSYLTIVGRNQNERCQSISENCLRLCLIDSPVYANWRNFKFMPKFYLTPAA